MTETNKQMNLKLGGMTCANCALKIETKLNNLDGVGTAVVNFANEEATVEYNPNATGFNKFKEAIRDLGYKASLAKIDLKVETELTEGNFNNFVNQVKEIEGIYDIRENYKASKMFIEFNESEVDETRLFSKIK
ncbi:MAG TPA: heavy-metal-associated domain-containing protein, partial [archaeon]|nr:heavy-metal-associated domain-containing protein [archaeon]